VRKSLLYRRYIPSKADRWGFKFYVLAESKTGYVKSTLVDEGAATQHEIENDDGFSDAEEESNTTETNRLHTAMEQQPTTAADIQSTPGKIVQRLMTPFLNKGHLLGIDNRYTDIDLVKWLVENGTDVRLISSVGTSKMIQANNSEKPRVIMHMHNQAMPGVDLADQKRHSHQIARNWLGKWYKKVFLYLLDVCITCEYEW
jgi:hypothetical protein